MSEVRVKGQKAKAASRVLVKLTTEEKNKALQSIADQLLKEKQYIMEENKKDLEAGKKTAFRCHS